MLIPRSHIHIQIFIFQDSNIIPTSVRRKAVDCLNLYERAIEEQEIVKQEMKNTIQYFEYQISLLDMELKTQPTTREEHGVYCILNEKKVKFISFLEECKVSFQEAQDGVVNIPLEAISDIEDDDDEENDQS